MLARPSAPVAELLRWTSLITLSLIWAHTSPASQLRVPQDFPTIQDALNATQIGDSVLVAEGVYFENLIIPEHTVTLGGGYLISMDSTSIEHTIIRPPEPTGGRCIWGAEAANGTAFRLVGMTVRGGTSTAGLSRGGAFIADRSVSVEWCRFDSSYAAAGGAIYLDSCLARIDHCRILNCGALEDGLALYLRNCESRVMDCEIESCFSAPAESDEYLITVDQGAIEVRNCEVHHLGWGTLPGAYAIRQVRDVRWIRISQSLIRDCRFRSFFALPYTGPASAPSFIEFDSNEVRRNEIQLDLFRSDEADSGSIARFTHNVFAENTGLSQGGYVSRMFFTVGGLEDRFEQVTIRNNLFVDNDSQENSVALILHTDSTRVDFSRNLLVNNACAGFANPPGGVLMLVGCDDGVVKENVIYDSEGYAAFQGIVNEPHSYARLNFWGDSSGPSHRIENPQGRGDSVEYLISVTPWLADSSNLARGDEAWRPPYPSADALVCIFPNPANSRVNFEFTLSTAEHLIFEVIDILGRKADVIVDGHFSAGVHRATWNAEGRASGVYYLRVLGSQVGLADHPRKILLLK